MASKRTGSHTGAQATVEVNSSFEGNIDDSITIFSEGDSPSTEHTGCSVTVEHIEFTKDEASSTEATDSETTDSEATDSINPGFRKPYRKVLRVTKEGRRRLKRGYQDERISGSIRLTEYVSYKASTIDTPSYQLRISAKTPTPSNSM